MSTALVEALRAAVGATHVLTEGDLAAWELDWRRRYRGRALAVVRPADTAEVAAVVRACAAHGTPLVPQGGNTGLVGGSVPDHSGRQVLLSLGRLNRVRSIDAANLTLTAEAGCVLQSVQEAAASQGLLFPLSLAAEGSCTIGGNLATNAGGTQVLRYGNAREQCLGLEVVTAAACWAFCRTQPASTVIVMFAASMPRTRSSRARLSTSCLPLASGTEPPTSPVLPPWGTMLVPCSAHSSTTCATSAVLPGRTTASALPCQRLRQSTSHCPRLSPVSTLPAPTTPPSPSRKALMPRPSRAGSALARARHRR